MENQSVEKRTNSLMNKTKKQLVEIILRKDDVHCKLNGTIKDMKNHFRVLTEDKTKDNKLIEELKEENIKLNEDIKQISNENDKLKEEFNKYKQYAIRQLADLNRDYSTLKEQYATIELDNNYYKEEIDNLTSKLVEYKNNNKLAYILTILSTVIVGIACFFVGISI